MRTKDFLDEESSLIRTLLDRKVVRVVIDDTAVEIGYQLYRDGALIERFFYSSDTQEACKDDEEEDDDDDERPKGTYEFCSESSLLKSEDIKDPYAFVNGFLIEKEAFIPWLFPRYQRGRPGDFFLLYRDGIEKSDFVRMDYLVLQ